MSQEEVTVGPVSKLVLAALGYALPGGLVLMLGVMAFALLSESRSRLIEARDAKRIAAAQEQQAELGQPAAAAAMVAATPPDGGIPAGGSEMVDVGLAAMMKEGKKNYATCAACHGPDGKGMQVGPQLMAPTLVGSELVMGEPDRMALVILKGIHREPTSEYVGMMAALESAYDDDQLASVMTYVRQSFGNNASEVTPEMASEAREKFSGVSVPGGVKREAIDEIVSGVQVE
ncbi:MAG: cytochrome c [Verrucomicrobiota bacterium]